jgi:hypothetical protein
MVSCLKCAKRVEEESCLPLKTLEGLTYLCQSCINLIEKDVDQELGLNSRAEKIIDEDLL